MERVYSHLTGYDITKSPNDQIPPRTASSNAAQLLGVDTTSTSTESISSIREEAMPGSFLDNYRPVDPSGPCIPAGVQTDSSPAKTSPLEEVARNDNNTPTSPVDAANSPHHLAAPTPPSRPSQRPARRLASVPVPAKAAKVLGLADAAPAHHEASSPPQPGLAPRAPTVADPFPALQTQRRPSGAARPHDDAEARLRSQIHDEVQERLRARYRARRPGQSAADVARQEMAAAAPEYAADVDVAAALADPRRFVPAAFASAVLTAVLTRVEALGL